MLAPELLALLCCPESRQELQMADAALIERLNVRIGQGTARNRAGEIIREPLQGGLVRGDRQWLYPIRNGIPVLLVPEAIPLA